MSVNVDTTAVSENLAVNGRCYAIGLALLTAVLASVQPAFATMWFTLALWSVLMFGTSYACDLALLVGKRHLQVAFAWLTLISGVAIPLATLYGLWS